jgi:hypothetical protein
MPPAGRASQRLRTGRTARPTVGVLVASAVVGTTHAHVDYFRADKAWFYIVLLTIAYMVSRGLAKSGSREHYNGS